MRKRFNADINNKLKEIFIFTKDNNDNIKYDTIVELVEDMEINSNELSFHLKYNHCMTFYKLGFYCYRGLRLK
tara:strand:- start:1695 stop:1913 length:219 start_codon:yes stop_codon:yes gene_type:complete